MITAVRGSRGATGCPCGCLTKPPWLDDEDCVRHRPIGAPLDWSRWSYVGVYRADGVHVVPLRDEWRWAA